jgi:hypothetical protein
MPVVNLELDSAAIEKFKEIYLRAYGQRLTNQEALELGTRLINFVKAVYGNNLPKLKDIDTNKKKEDN